MDNTRLGIWIFGKNVQIFRVNYEKIKYLNTYNRKIVFEIDFVKINYNNSKKYMIITKT